MKIKFVLLLALVFITTFTTIVFANTSYDESDTVESDRVVTDMDIFLGRNVRQLTPIEQHQEGNIWEITVAPFLHDNHLHDRIDIYVEMFDQYGYEFWDEDIIWDISCSIDSELLYTVYGWDLIGLNFIVLYTDVTGRIITVTAKSYSNPTVYITIKITVDPNRANIKTSWPHAGRLYGGRLSTMTVPVFFNNTPDGSYPATLITSPRSDDGMAHDFYGIRLEGDWETEILEAAGTITVIDGIGELTFTSYNTPARFRNYWVWMTLEVDMGELGVASTIVQIEFDPILDPPPPPIITEVNIPRENVTILTDFGNLLTSVKAYDVNGREVWDHVERINWSAEGLHEGDYIHWINLNHHLHIGPSQQKRVITLTATATCNPAVYDSIEITVDPSFVQEANEISIAHSQSWFFEDALHIVRPTNFFEWVSVSARDQYRIRMPHENLIWRVESEVDSDKIIMSSGGFYLYIGAEEIEREITITATSNANPHVYATLIVSVDPSLPTLGMLQAVDFEGTLTSGAAGSTTVSLFIPYLPDGTYRAMLSLPHLWMQWDAPNMSFQNGRIVPWGDITFENGNATITINTRANAIAGEWEFSLTLRLPDELRDEYHHPFAAFTLTVE
ncbi:MAG: hypothetical protein FWC91_13970 [Defluviitaleaceae bacterium]|nr:hypothetical protein [Defluviitaleaceae bacterium]